MGHMLHGQGMPDTRHESGAASKTHIILLVILPLIFLVRLV